MRIDDIDIYDLPMWLQAVFEAIERNCCKTLEAESEFYQAVLDETHELLDEYRFLSTLVDGDTIEEPMNLSIKETEALSKFWRLETDRREMETIQIYFMGAKHMWELMELLKLKK